MLKFSVWQKWIYNSIKNHLLNLFLIIVLEILLSLSGISFAIISKNLIDNAVLRNKNLLFLNFIFLSMYIVLSISLSAFLSIKCVNVYELIKNDMQKKFVEKLLQLEWREYSKYHSGDILTRITRDIENVADTLVYTIPQIISFGFKVTAAFITLFYFAHMLALIAVFIAPIFLVFSHIWGRKYKKLHTKLQESESKLTSLIEDLLQNIIIIKAYCVETATINKLQRFQSNRSSFSMLRNKMSSISSAVISLGFWVGYFLAFMWGVFGIYAGTATFGTMTVFLQLVEQIQSPLVGLAYSYPKILASIASVERLIEFKNLNLEKRIEAPKSKHLIGVKFEEVSFSYNDKLTVLNSVSFEIKPGEKIALVGTSGEGKTTIIRLILALVSPQSGNIFFTDKNGKIALASADSRKYISYVPQGNTLFSGTLRENLQLAKSGASEEEIYESLKKSCAMDFVKELPEGIDTEIGEKGVGLSEGQAQRIAIARALLNDSPILILDEATSALDVDTEKKILDSLSALAPNTTCIVVTHRQSALRICDRIFKLEKGTFLDCREESNE